MTHIKGISDEKSSLMGLFLRIHKIAHKSQCYLSGSTGPFYDSSNLVRVFLCMPSSSFSSLHPLALEERIITQINKMEKGRYKEEGLPLPSPNPFL